MASNQIKYPDLTEIYALQKKLQNAKTKNDEPKQHELTSATFKLLCEFLPCFMEGTNSLNGISNTNLELKSQVSNLTLEVKSCRDEILAMNNEREEHETTISNEFMSLKGETGLMQNQIEKLKLEIESLKLKNQEYDKKFLTIEVEKSESSILIRNFSGPQKENQNILRENFTRLLQFMKIDQKVKVLDIFRLMAKIVPKYTQSSSFAPLKITFSSKYEKLTFMSQLKTLQNSPFANLRVSDDVPRSLKNDYELVNNAAYRIRKSNPKGTKVRTPIRNLKYQLEIKKPNEQKFSKIDVNSVAQVNQPAGVTPRGPEMVGQSMVDQPPQETENLLSLPAEKKRRLSQSNDG